jgi:hypothetical protein
MYYRAQSRHTHNAGQRQTHVSLYNYTATRIGGDDGFKPCTETQAVGVDRPMMHTVPIHVLEVLSQSVIMYIPCLVCRHRLQPKKVS